MKTAYSKIVFVGCVETGYYCANKMIENGIIPSGLVSLDQLMAQRNNVSGYKDFFTLPVNCERYRPKKYSLKSKEDIAFFESRHFDLLVVLGWQRLIPGKIIESLRICGLTIHGSGEGLPKGRGRSPMNWALIEGLDIFYLSLLTLSSEADGGKVLDTVTFDILASDTIKTLYYKNALQSSKLFINNIPLYLQVKNTAKNKTIVRPRIIRKGYPRMAE